MGTCPKVSWLSVAFILFSFRSGFTVTHWELPLLDLWQFHLFLLINWFSPGFSGQSFLSIVYCIETAVPHFKAAPSLSYVAAYLHSQQQIPALPTFPLTILVYKYVTNAALNASNTNYPRLSVVWNYQIHHNGFDWRNISFPQSKWLNHYFETVTPNYRLPRLEKRPPRICLSSPLRI